MSDVSKQLMPSPNEHAITETSVECQTYTTHTAASEWRFGRQNCNARMTGTKQIIAVKWFLFGRLTPSMPAVPNCCCLKGPVPYWSNLPFLIFDIWALWRPINTKKRILLSYLSYLFRLWLLSEDSYLLEGLQSADETKTHPKASNKTHPLLSETEATLTFVYFW